QPPESRCHAPAPVPLAPAQRSAAHPPSPCPDAYPHPPPPDVPSSATSPVDPQPARHPGHRAPPLTGLLPDLEHHPYGPLTQLVGTLLRCWHDSHLRKVRSLQRTQGSSWASPAPASWPAGGRWAGSRVRCRG